MTVIRGSSVRSGVVRPVLATAVALLVGALGAGAATAAPAAGSAASTSASLCSVARGVGRDLINSQGTLHARLSPAKLKEVYTRIQAAEPALLNAASGRMKTDLRQVFGFFNIFIGDLKKANWEYANLAPYATTLSARSRRIQPALTRVNTYFKKKCKF